MTELGYVAVHIKTCFSKLNNTYLSHSKIIVKKEISYSAEAQKRSS